jgi:hypothetical protein
MKYKSLYPPTAIKNDASYIEKPPLDYIPTEAIMEVARVFGFGAQKYAAENWRKGFTHRRLAASAQRHILQFLDGEDKDTESELEHLAHAVAALLMLLEHRFKGYGDDDRHVRTK